MIQVFKIDFKFKYIFPDQIYIKNLNLIFKSEFPLILKKTTYFYKLFLKNLKN